MRVVRNNDWLLSVETTFDTMIQWMILKRVAMPSWLTQMKGMIIRDVATFYAFVVRPKWPTGKCAKHCSIWRQIMVKIKLKIVATHKSRMRMKWWNFRTKAKAKMRVVQIIFKEIIAVWRTPNWSSARSLILQGIQEKSSPKYYSSFRWEWRKIRKSMRIGQIKR